MSSFSIELPADFADYEWEVEAKGWFPGATMVVSGKRYRLNFYAPQSLGHDIESQLRTQGLFFEPNLVVIETVNEANMRRAAEHLAHPELIKLLLPES